MTTGRWIVAVIVGLVVLGLLVGEEEENGSEPEPSGSARSEEFRATPADVEQLVEEEVDGDPQPEALCTQRTNCGVSYTIEELVGFDTDRELLDEQRDVWRDLFSDPKLESAVITLRAPLVSAGGKESTDDALRVRCDRRAARQIDWDAVEPEGFKQLCDWQELVGF